MRGVLVRGGWWVKGYWVKGVVGIERLFETFPLN